MTLGRHSRRMRACDLATLARGRRLGRATGRPGLSSSHHEPGREHGHSREREAKARHRWRHANVVHCGSFAVCGAAAATAVAGCRLVLTFWTTETILLSAGGDWSAFASGVGCDTSADG